MTINMVDERNEEKVLERLEVDYTNFREEMQALPSADVYDYAYKIFSVEEIHEILINTYEFTKLQADAILNCKENIFERIYTEWIDRDGSQYDAFCSVIATALESMN